MSIQNKEREYINFPGTCSMPFTFPYLEKFCFCMDLITGVRVISVLALVIGESFIFMGAATYNDDPPYVWLSSMLFYIMGVLFCCWFLFLLLLQSLKSKFPRKLVIQYAKFLLIWLLITVSLLVLISHLEDINKQHKISSQERFYVTVGIIISIFGFIAMAYSLWALISYIHYVTLVEASQPPRVRVIQDLSDENESPPEFQEIYLNRKKEDFQLRLS